MARGNSKGGRPTKLTPKVHKIIMEGLEVGMTYDGAATRAGITERTRQNWYNRGEDVYYRLEAAGDEEVDLSPDDTLYLRFFLGHNEAVAQGQFSHWVNLENHAPNRPDISQWILQNRHGIRPPAQRHEITGADGGAIEVNELSADERLARIVLLLDAARSRRDGQASSDAD